MFIEFQVSHFLRHFAASDISITSSGLRSDDSFRIDEPRRFGRTHVVYKGIRKSAVGVDECAYSGWFGDSHRSRAGSNFGQFWWISGSKRELAARFVIGTSISKDRVDYSTI